MYEERIMGRSRPAPYQRMDSLVGRQPSFRRSEDDREREADFDYGRRGGGLPYGGDKRREPPYRREDPYFYNRGFIEEHPESRQTEFRSRGRGNLQASSTSSRGQRAPPRSLMGLPFRGDNGVTHSSANPNQRDAHQSLKRKAPFSPSRDRSPPFSHTRSSRSYSPESSKSNCSQPSQSKKNPVNQEKERPPSCRSAESQDGSPHSAVLETKEDVAGARVDQIEETKVKEEPGPTPEDCRAHVIANKALEIEKLYRQDCETFGTVVKMLVAKQPSLEKQLETALKENLTEIKERCLEDLRQFISEVNVVLDSDQT